MKIEYCFCRLPSFQFICWVFELQFAFCVEISHLNYECLFFWVFKDNRLCVQFQFNKLLHDNMYAVHVNEHAVGFFYLYERQSWKIQKLFNEIVWIFFLFLELGFFPLCCRRNGWFAEYFTKLGRRRTRCSKGRRICWGVQQQQQ